MCGTKEELTVGPSGPGHPAEPGLPGRPGRPVRPCRHTQINLYTVYLQQCVCETTNAAERLGIKMCFTERSHIYFNAGVWQFVSGCQFLHL